VSYVCEALILIYLGLSVDSFEGTNDMISYAIADFFILLIARFGTIFFLASFMRCFKKKQSGRLSVKELIVVGTSGMIRGSIAYALIVKLAFHGVSKQNKDDLRRSK